MIAQENNSLRLSSSNNAILSVSMPHVSVIKPVPDINTHICSNTVGRPLCQAATYMHQQVLSLITVSNREPVGQPPDPVKIDI